MVGVSELAIPKIDPARYRGHSIELSAEADDELTRVGRGTPCGEYLRRFWHPFALSEDLGELPIAVRVMGEDLVLFRDKSGRVGLVHKRCPHRQASLEFGTCEADGIRCCYHGWLFAVDGTLLEAPGQPGRSQDNLCKKIKLGAYPAFEFKGLIFAYLGPPEDVPEFPLYDALLLDGMEMTPYKAPFECNWLQVLDAILDPIHTAFLHSNISRVQFSEGFGEVGKMDFFERESWMLGVATRRVGENVWMRINELVFPNFTQAGAAFATDGTKQRYYGRSAFSRWVVPIDDEQTICFAWANFGDRGDPPEWNTWEGPQLIEQGELFERPYEERQRYPADLEACEGMGPINIHKNEHLAPSDKGIGMMRRRLRRQIRAVAAGDRPMMATDKHAVPLPTYGGDTVLTIPKNGSDAEDLLLGRLAQEFVRMQFDVDGRPEEERLAIVTEGLKDLERRARDGEVG